MQITALDEDRIDYGSTEDSENTTTLADDFMDQSTDLESTTIINELSISISTELTTSSIILDTINTTTSKLTTLKYEDIIETGKNNSKYSIKN